ncbi:MAG: Kelch repeat-containing protein [Parashewanella sp.]
MLSSNKFLLLIFSFVLLSGCVSTSKTDELSLKSPRYGHAAANDGKNIYVLSGYNGSGALSDIEIINPDTNKVTVLKNKLIPRRFFSAVWDGKHSIYILGGMSFLNKQAMFEPRVEVFNTLTHEVTFAKPLPFPTTRNTAAYVDEKIFVFGGSRFLKDKLAATVVNFEYDITQNKWSKKANMPTAKSSKAVVKDGLIYLVGGYSDNKQKALAVFEQYNPKTDQWTSLPSLPVTISAHSTDTINDKLYTFGDYHKLTSSYFYDFKNKKWQAADIKLKGSRHNAVTTIKGKTYIIGGNTNRKSKSAVKHIQIFKL